MVFQRSMASKFATKIPHAAAAASLSSTNNEKDAPSRNNKPSHIGVSTMTSIDAIVLKPASSRLAAESSVDYYAAAAAMASSDQDQVVVGGSTNEQHATADAQGRVPCTICGRNFLPAALERHIRVCEKVSRRDRVRQENREKHELMKREKDEKQARMVQAQIAASLPDILRHKPTKQLRAADGGLLTVYQCTHCSRFFQQGTYERHYAFCEQQAQCRGGGSGGGRTSKGKPPVGVKSTPSVVRPKSYPSGGGWNAGAASEQKLDLLNRRMYYKPPLPLSGAKSRKTGVMPRRRARKNDVGDEFQQQPQSSLSNTTTRSLGEVNKRRPADRRINSKHEATMKTGHDGPSPYIDDVSGSKNLPLNKTLTKTKSAPNLKGKRAKTKAVVEKAASINHSTSANGDDDDYSVLAERLDRKQVPSTSQKRQLARKVTALPLVGDNSFRLTEETDNERSTYEQQIPTTTNRQTTRPAEWADDTTEDSDALRRYERQMTQVISRTLVAKKRPQHQAQSDSATDHNNITAMPKALRNGTKAAHYHNVDALLANNSDDDDGGSKSDRHHSKAYQPAQKPAPASRKFLSQQAPKTNPIDLQMQCAEQILFEAKQSLQQAEIGGMRRDGHGPARSAVASTSLRQGTKFTDNTSDRSSEQHIAHASNSTDQLDEREEIGYGVASERQRKQYASVSTGDNGQRNDLTHSQYPLSVAADQELELLTSAHKQQHHLRPVDSLDSVKATASRPAADDDGQQHVSSRMKRRSKPDDVVELQRFAMTATASGEHVTSPHDHDAQRMQFARTLPPARASSEQTNQNGSEQSPPPASDGHAHNNHNAKTTIVGKGRSARDDAKLKENTQFSSNSIIASPTPPVHHFYDAAKDSQSADTTRTAAVRSAQVPPAIVPRKANKKKHAITTNSTRDGLTPAHDEHIIMTDVDSNSNLQRLQPLTVEEQKHVARRHHNSGNLDGDIDASRQQAIRAQVAQELLARNSDVAHTVDDLSDNDDGSQQHASCATLSKQKDQQQHTTPKRRQRSAKNHVPDDVNNSIEPDDTITAVAGKTTIPEKLYDDSSSKRQANGSATLSGAAAWAKTSGAGKAARSYRPKLPLALLTSDNNHHQPLHIDEDEASARKTAAVRYDCNSPSASDLGIIDVDDDDEYDRANYDSSDKMHRGIVENSAGAYSFKSGFDRPRSKDASFYDKSVATNDYAQLPQLKPVRSSSNVPPLVNNDHQAAGGVTPLQPLPATPYGAKLDVAAVTSQASRSPSRIRQPTSFTTKSSGDNNYSNVADSTARLFDTGSLRQRQRESRTHYYDDDSVSVTVPKLPLVIHAKTAPASASSATAVAAAAQMDKVYGINLDKLDDWLSNWDGLSCHWCRFSYPDPPADYEWDSVRYCVRCGTRRLRSSFKRAAHLQKKREYRRQTSRSGKDAAGEFINGQKESTGLRQETIYDQEA